VTDKPLGFVPLTSLSGRAADPAKVLGEIRDIYFRTSRRTIEHDFAHAIELVKSLPDEETRQRAHVYMEGIAEMRKEWAIVRREKATGKGKSEGKRKP
jgi:hypothetical protein